MDHGSGRLADARDAAEGIGESNRLIAGRARPFPGNFAMAGVLALDSAVQQLLTLEAFVKNVLMAKSRGQDQGDRGLLRAERAGRHQCDIPASVAEPCSRLCPLRAAPGNEHA